MVVRFLAIEEHQLNFPGQIGVLPDYARQFQQQTRAGAAVVGSDKPDGVEQFCVVMRAQQKRGRRRVPFTGKSGNQIYELDLAPRRVVTERLPRYLPTRSLKLPLDVISGFLKRLGSSRARPEIDKPLNLSKGFLARKFLPNFRRVAHGPGWHEKQKHNQSGECERCRTVHRLNVLIFRSELATSNAQRSTPNAQFRQLDVGR